MTRAKPPSLPIADSKTAALSRVLDLVPKGYRFYTKGCISADKLDKLLAKFHEQYGIGGSPAQRITRKKLGLANAFLVVYLPPKVKPLFDPDKPRIGLPRLPEDEDSSVTWPVHSSQADSGMVEWLLLVTPGTGPAWEQEILKNVEDQPRLTWLGYELIRHEIPSQKTAWTWRRTKEEMANWYALLESQANPKQMWKVEAALEMLARQPGFAGVRKQSWNLIQFVRQHGYKGPVPYLYFLQKVSHGKRRSVKQDEVKATRHGRN